MLTALLVGVVALSVAMNLGRISRILKLKELTLASRSDLAGWQLLDAVTTVGMIVLFLNERIWPAIVYMAASFYLTLIIPGKSQAIVDADPGVEKPPAKD